MVLYPSADELRQREQQVAASSSNPSAHHAASQQQATPYLSHNQQDLLLAALNSQAGSTQNVYQSSTDPGRSNRSTSNPSQPTMNGSSLFMSPQNAELENFDGDYTPDLDYLDGDSYDFENADLGGEMIGALPGENGNGEGHEKRKSPDENDGSEEGDSKRQETQEGEKGAKKPGRKPLTNEPTTVSITYRQDMTFHQLLTSISRNGKRRTELHSAPSASAKRSISKTSRPK